MVLSVRALTAKRAPVSADNLTQLIEQYLGATGFAGDMIREMADYPPQQPTSYRRTGTIGRNWRLDGPRRTATAITAGASNKTKYDVYVQGPKDGSGPGRRQTKVMRSKGWKNITDVTKAVWPKHRVRIVRVLTQHDPAVRIRRI